MTRVKERSTAVARRLRSMGGRVLRRARLLPEGVADGLGDDEILQSSAFSGKIVVSFPNTPTDLADLRRWYPTLRALEAQYGLTIVTQDSRVTAAVQRETTLEVVTVALYATLDGLLSRSSVQIALYVSDHAWNFSMLRFTSLAHVLLLDVTDVQRVRNQVKAYDFCLLRKLETIDELKMMVTGYDFGRCLLVGGSPTAADGEQDVLLKTFDRLIIDQGIEWKRLLANGAGGP